jgi:excisionase family DNA binding protein
MLEEIELRPLAHTIPRAAFLSGLSRSTIYVLIKGGELPTVKVGRRTLISDDDLRVLIERHRMVPRDNQGERRATIRMRMAPGVG